MNRIPLIDPAHAEGKSKTLFDAVQAKMGMVPNMTRVLANAPAALESYLQFSGAMAGAKLSPRIREQIALTVGEVNSCVYCVRAHATIGGRLGLDAATIAAARDARSSDPKVDALLKFARDLVVERGALSDEGLARLRGAGVTDGEIVETIAAVSLNIFTNYVNHVADTVIDFPEIKA